MLHNRVIKSLAGVLGIRLFFVLVIGALLVILSSPLALAQSITDGFNLRMNNAIPTTGELADSIIYLPMLMKNFPYNPDTPVLEAISNEDGDGNYTVGWSSAAGADTFILQEDNQSDFSNPTTAYAGANTSTVISGMDMGTYYYRVQASNAYANSDWSNIESTEVTAEPAACPQSGPWFGPTSQEDGSEISFVVENSPQCQIPAESLVIEFEDSCGSDINMKIMTSALITNNHFSVNGENTTISGDFSAPDTASGTFSYSDGGCTASGTWTADVNLGADRTVYALAVQADGKILVGGSFTWLRGERRARIGRLNPDGTIDDSFNPGADGTVNALAVQADGKILVGGDFNELGGETHYYIARLNPDGTLDTGFNPENYYTGLGWGVNALVVQADGKIVAGGDFRNWDAYSHEYIVRLNTDGSTDQTFNRGFSSPVHTLALQSDGKILVGIKGYMGTDWKERCPIYRLNTDGSRDLTFLVSVEGFVNGVVVYTDVRTLLVQSDDKILVGGYYDELEGEKRYNIGRVDPEGTLDDAFNPGATPWTTSSYVATLIEQSDGDILVGGSFTTLGGESRARIGRLNSDGSPDMDFNPGADKSVYTLAVQADGKILVGGIFTELGGETHYYIGRLNSDGTLDNTFP